MATTISVSNILTNTAQLIGVPPFAPNTNVTEPQAIAWCQQALESLQALNAQNLGADHHHISSITVQTQPDIHFVSLPSDAIEVFDVIWMRSPDLAYRLHPAEERYVLPLGSTPKVWQDAPHFRIEGNALVFFPCPHERYLISVWYGQAFTVSAPTSTVQGRLDWQSWIELDVAIKCLVRKRRLVDVQDMTARRDALSAQLFAAGRNRSRAGPVRIQDVESPGYWWRGHS